MALTKVKLIADGVIDVNHLASGHGITTDNIGEGSNLYYTDARVSTYLSTNSYATEGWVNTNYLALSGGTLTGNLTMNGSNLIAFGNGTQYINSPDGSDLTLGAADDINFNASYMRYFNSSNVEYARLHGTSGDSWINGGGNLGINTNTPTQRLHVAGTIYTNAGNFKIDSGYELTWGNGNTSILGNTATGYLDFRTSNGTKMYIDNSGNVGIGNTSPVGKLNVALPGDSNGNVGSWGSNQVVFTRGGTSTSQGLGFSVHDVDNTATISSLTPAVTWSNLDYRAQAHTFYSNGNTLGICQNISGNVGIGTTNPTHKLHLVEGGTVDTMLKLEQTRAAYANNIIMTAADDNGGRWNSVRSQTNGGTEHWAIGGLGSGANTFTIKTAGTEKIRVTSDGKVGIGESSPSAKLQTSSGGYILNGGYALFGSYTADGLFSTNARPNYLSTNGYGSTYSKYSGGNSGLLLGYQDNGAGLYSPAYGFEVKSIDGRPVGGQVVKAIVMRDVDTGVEPFWVNNNGSAFFNDSISIGKTSALGGSFHVYGNTGVFQSPTNGSSVIDSNTYSLLLGPKENRNPTANTYYGGIAFNHLLNYNGGTGYNVNSHAWIGLRLYDTPASERSSLVFATKEGTGTTSSDVPIERMTINPFGMVGIGTSTPSQISSGVPTLTINSPNSNTLSGGVIYQANGSSQAYNYWENNFLVHQVQGTGAHKFAQGASTKFAVYSEGIDIVPGLQYSQQYTYSSSWASSFQQVVPNGTLDSTRVYLFTIWTNSFGVAPYYAAASAILTTAQSTNDNSAGPAIDLLTAHHVGSGSKWQIKMSSGGSSTNGVQVMLAGGPSVSSIPVFVRVTMLSNF